MRRRRELLFLVVIEEEEKEKETKKGGGGESVHEREIQKRGKMRGWVWMVVELSYVVLWVEV